MPWYKTGTVSVVQNSNAVIGAGTAFIANARVGDAFRGPDGGWYEVNNIASDTAMSIAPPYQGVTNNSGIYALAPMQGYVKDSADALRALVNQFGGILAVLGETPTTAGVRAALNLSDADGLPEGATNKYMSALGVRGITLAGIDLVTQGAVVATDSILSALGKLQATKADKQAGALGVSQGGTGATTEAGARTALGARGIKNRVINGNFSINQRAYVSGTATTSANQYTLDRWRVVVSGQSVVYATSGIGFKVTAPAGGIEQVVESVSAGIHTLSWIGNATATVNGTAITNGGQTAALAAGSNPVIRFSGGFVEDVSLVPGAVPVPFESRLPGEELMLCKRYYEATSCSFYSEGGAARSFTSRPVFWSVEKRTVPTLTAAITNPSNYYNHSAITPTKYGCQLLQQQDTAGTSSGMLLVYGNSEF